MTKATTTTRATKKAQDSTADPVALWREALAKWRARFTTVRGFDGWQVMNEPATSDMVRPVTVDALVLQDRCNALRETVAAGSPLDKALARLAETILEWPHAARTTQVIAAANAEAALDRWLRDPLAQRDGSGTGASESGSSAKPKPIPIDVVNDPACVRIREILEGGPKLLHAIETDRRAPARRRISERLRAMREAGMVEQTCTRGPWRLVESRARSGAR